MRSHVQIKRDMSFHDLPDFVADTIERLRDEPKLWNPNIPDMIGAYFTDLRGILVDIRLALPKNGRVYIVVGDSRYYGQDILVAKGLAEMSSSLHFSVVDVEPFRSMRASPQQGGRRELAESLIILSAV